MLPGTAQGSGPKDGVLPMSPAGSVGWWSAGPALLAASRWSQLNRMRCGDPVLSSMG